MSKFTFSGILKENLFISLGAIKSHMLRTILTVLIIAFGIMALVGILTSIDAIKFYLNKNFTMMGANTFTVQNRSMHIHIGGQETKPKHFRPITYDEALRFKSEFKYPANTSIFVWASGGATAKYSSKKTNPNVRVMGTDEDYLVTSGYDLSKGRNFTPNEVYYGDDVAVVGSDIIKKLFKPTDNPIDKDITIGSVRYRVIGVLKEKGSTLGFNPDNIALLPLNNVRGRFSRPNVSYSINVTLADGQQMEAAIGEATGILRIIRQVELWDEDSFDISKSDNLANMLFDSLKYLRYAAIIIGMITMLGASIGLMNILLVSVTERTREIGIRKAIGATSHTIRNQFLMEAIVIAQIGGLLGIIFGITIGNLLSISIGSSFIIPWVWIIMAFVLCLGVALLAGLLPAVKAAKLDPIESLRYE